VIEVVTLVRDWGRAEIARAAIALIDLAPADVLDCASPPEPCDPLDNLVSIVLGVRAAIGARVGSPFLAISCIVRVVPHPSLVEVGEPPLAIVCSKPFAVCGLRRPLRREKPLRIRCIFRLRFRPNVRVIFKVVESAVLPLPIAIGLVPVLLLKPLLLPQFRIGRVARPAARIQFIRMG